jgi:hypothetical protein
MSTERLVAYLGAAALVAAAVAFALALMGEGEAPPKRPREPSLFSFIKPLDYPAPARQDRPSGTAPDATQAARDIAAAQAVAQAMRAQGAGADEIDRMRARILPTETAAGLAQMDRAEAMWNGRVKAYLDERRRVLDDLANAPAAERERALRLLRDTRFTSEEQTLLANYDAGGVPRLIQEAAADDSRLSEGAGR